VGATTATLGGLGLIGQKKEMETKDLQKLLKTLEDHLNKNVDDTKELFVDMARIMGTLDVRVKYLEKELSIVQARLARTENKGERLH